MRILWEPPMPEANFSGGSLAARSERRRLARTCYLVSEFSKGGVAAGQRKAEFCTFWQGVSWFGNLLVTCWQASLSSLTASLASSCINASSKFIAA